MITWVAAAAHEVPQELGDFGILIRGGWSKLAALSANFVSPRVVPGALLAYSLSGDFDGQPVAVVCCWQFPTVDSVVMSGNVEV